MASTDRTPPRQPDTADRAGREELRVEFRKRAQAVVLTKHSYEVSQEYLRLCRDAGIAPDED
jgi:hypothetical protein